MLIPSNRLSKTWVDFIQAIRGWDSSQDLIELEKSQWLPLAEVQKINFNRLCVLLEHCQRNVPFYRDAMKASGFDLKNFRSLDDLRSLPLVTKSDLRRNYEQFRAEGNQGVYDVWSSSGSTGEPFSFIRDRRSIKANTFAALARGRRWWGMEYGLPEGMIWSGLSDLTGTVGGRFAALRRRISWSLKNVTLVDVYLLNDEAIQGAYQAFERSRPKGLRAIASGLLRFCDGIEKLGLDGRKLGIEIAIYTGEGLSNPQRQRIETILGCKTVSEYGCTELGIIAFECPEGGLHISHENLIVEYLVNGRPAQEGERGELVITNLNDRIYPLLRYKTGDIAVPTDRTCPCGRSLPLMKEMQGREHDFIQTPQGKTIHGLFFTHLFDQLQQVRQFRVIQKQLDQLSFEIVIAGEEKNRICSLVQTMAQDKLDEPMKVSVLAVDSIPVSSSGKTRWIISEVNK